MNDTFSLRSSSLRTTKHFQGADTDPMSSMGNLMDVMLVFSCALLIALVTHYNVQLSPDANENSEAQPVEGQLETAGETQAEVDGMSVVGTLYYDQETDEFYVLPE